MNEFGMFTDKGNQRVGVLVRYAIAQRMPWDDVYHKLIELSKHPEFEECCDTEVRESVYEAIGYDQGEQNASR